MDNSGSFKLDVPAARQGTHIDDPENIGRFGQYYSWGDNGVFSEKVDYIGRSIATFHSPKNKQVSKKWEEALLQPIAYELKLGNYSWPPRGAMAEKLSFKLQADAFIENAERPSQDVLEETYKKVLPLYVKHSLPSYLLKYDRNVWRQQIRLYKSFVKPEASPGVPYALMANRNDQLFSKLGSEFEDLVLDRIEKRLSYSMEEVADMSRMERIDKGLCDPVRLFVKDEPHKLEKIKTNRVRLIHCVSVIDKMIEMLVSRHICKLEINNWKTIPSKPGIGFTDEDNSFVYQDMMSAGQMAFTDAKGWDMSVKEWMLFAEAEMRILLCENPSRHWLHLVALEPIFEGQAVFQFSDGELVAPRYNGIVLSGKLKTSSGNSRIRTLMAYLIGGDDMKKVAAAGDDTVESWIDGAIEKYRKYGIIIKDYQRVTDGFEFCSRWYQKDGSFPLNFEKMLMNLLHTDPQNDFERDMYLLGFTDQMKDHPLFPKMMVLLEEVGYISDLSRGGSNNYN